MVAERPETSISARLRLNCWEPGRLQAHKKAAALIKEMSIFGLTRGVVDFARNSGSMGSEVDGSSIFSETDARIEGLVSGTEFSMCVIRKVILLNTQSINRL